MAAALHTLAPAAVGKPVVVEVETSICKVMKEAASKPVEAVRRAAVGVERMAEVMVVGALYRAVEMLAGVVSRLVVREEGKHKQVEVAVRILGLAAVKCIRTEVERVAHKAAETVVTASMVVEAVVKAARMVAEAVVKAERMAVEMGAVVEVEKLVAAAARMVVEGTSEVVMEAEVEAGVEVVVGENKLVGAVKGAEVKVKVVVGSKLAEVVVKHRPEEENTEPVVVVVAKYRPGEEKPAAAEAKREEQMAYT